MTRAERRLDQYRGWLLAVARLATPDPQQAEAFFQKWSRVHGVSDDETDQDR